MHSMQPTLTGVCRVPQCTTTKRQQTLSTDKQGHKTRPAQPKTNCHPSQYAAGPQSEQRHSQYLLLVTLQAATTTPVTLPITHVPTYISTQIPPPAPSPNPKNRLQPTEPHRELFPGSSVYTAALQSCSTTVHCADKQAPKNRSECVVHQTRAHTCGRVSAAGGLPHTPASADPGPKHPHAAIIPSCPEPHAGRSSTGYQLLANQQNNPRLPYATSQQDICECLQLHARNSLHLSLSVCVQGGSRRDASFAAAALL